MAPRPVAPNFGNPVVIYRQLPQPMYNGQLGQVRPGGIPNDWQANPTIYRNGQPSGGQIFQSPDGNGFIRVMPNGNAVNPNGYVKQQLNQQFFDQYGDPVPGYAPEAHIPIEEYQFNPEIFIE